MKKNLALLGVAAALLVGAPPALAGPRSSESINRMGSGTKITCGTTPTLLWDATFVPSDAFWLVISSGSSNGSIFLGGPSVGDGGFEIPGKTRLAWPLAKGGAVYCWAPSATTINVTGAE